MANVIESLIITLGLDPTKLTAGLHLAEEDLKKLGHKAQETAEEVREAGEKAGEFFEKLKEHAIEFFGVMASVGALVAFTEHTIKSGTAMMHLSEQTKMSVEDISLWQNAVTIAGGSAEGFNRTLEGLSKKLVSIETNMPRAKAAMRAFTSAGFGDLVAIGKHTDLTDVYAAAHEKFQHMELAKAITLGERMQLDKETIRVLHKSGEEYDEFMAKAKEAGLVTKEQAEASEQAEEGMNEFRISMQRAVEQIVVLALPAIKWMSGALTKVAHWAHENSGPIEAALLGIGAAALILGGNALVAGAQMALAWAIGLGPITLIAAAIAAYIAVVALLYQKFEGFRSLINANVALYKNAFAAIFDLIEILVGVFTLNTDKIKEGWDNFCKHLGQAGRKLEVILRYSFLLVAFGIMDAFKMAWEGVKSGATAFFTWIGSKLKKLGHALASLIPGSKGSVETLDNVSMVDLAPAPSPTVLPQAPTRSPLPAPHPSGFPVHAASTGPVGASPQAPTSAPPESSKPKVVITDEMFQAAWNARHPPSAQESVRQAALRAGRTSNTTASMHVDTINVNAPNATDASGVAGGITQAMAEQHKDLVNQADGGMI